MTETAGAARPPRLLAAVLALIGLTLLAGGVWLVALGGSFYYALAGIAVVVSAIFLWQGRKLGAWIYIGMLVATLIWGLFEVGFDPWGLVPRIVAPAVLGLWLAIPRVWKSLA